MEEDLNKRRSLFDALKHIKTPYRGEVDEFVEYLSETGIDEYLRSLSQRSRRDRSGPKISFFASWYTQRLIAAKQAVRYLRNHSPELTNGRRYTIEKYLQAKRQKKPKEGIAKADRVPTREAIEILIQEADHRFGMMIEFLAQTSCRVCKAKHGGDRELTRIAIEGKGEIFRDVKCSNDLYDRIRKEFHGRLLFDHGGKPYSRVSTTNRIKQLAYGDRAYDTSPQGTVLSEQYGVSKAASELGHKNIRNTKQYYNHTELGEDEFLDNL